MEDKILIQQEVQKNRHQGVISILASFKSLFFGIALLSIIINLLMLTPTFYMLQIYDRILLSQSELTLLFTTLLIIFLFILMSGSEWLRSKWLVHISIQFNKKLNELVFNASYDNPKNYQAQNPTQSFTDLLNLRQFLTGNGMIAFFDLPWTPIYIAVIFLLHPSLGFLTIGFVLLQLLIALFGQKLLKRSNDETLKADQKNKAFIFAKLRNAETVEAMGMSEDIYARWISVQEDYQDQYKKTMDRQQTQQVIIKFTRYAMQSLMLGAGALLVIKGELSAGSMIAANVLTTRALQPMDFVIASWAQMSQAKVAYRDLNLLIKAQDKIKSVIDHPSPSGAVRFKNLTALSPQNHDPILKNIDIQFKAGQMTAIIGPSGSGKTTFARCLLGIWPHTTGDLLLDDTSIATWPRETLGPYLGYLPQDIELLSGTIAENIARFNTPDSLKVIEAATQAGIHQMILKLPMGYDTQIGDAGNILSGGQKQLLALARALYDDPKIIILDEPNANLDDTSERMVMDTLAHLKARGKTVFIIAHRLNQLTGIDYIMSLKAGEIERYEPFKNLIGH